MIKLSANVSKKVPVPDVEFSSRSYSAGMEIEVSGEASQQEIKEKLRRLYSLLAESIGEQIAEGSGKTAEKENAHSSSHAQQSNRKRSKADNGTNGRAATEAQIKAIRAIAKDQSYSDSRLSSLVSARFGGKEVQDLSLSEASSLIDLLKKNGEE